MGRLTLPLLSWDPANHLSGSVLFLAEWANWKRKKITIIETQINQKKCTFKKNKKQLTNHIKILHRILLHQHPFIYHCLISVTWKRGFWLQKVLISNPPQLHEIRFQAVHFFVDLHVSHSLRSKLLLQLLLAAVDLLHSWLQLSCIVLNPEGRWREKRKNESCKWLQVWLYGCENAFQLGAYFSVSVLLSSVRNMSMYSLQ